MALGADTYMYIHITDKNNLKKQCHAEDKHMNGLKIWVQETFV